jgi:molybdopterin converting factor subunit 1
MQVELLFFASLREVMGRGAAALELPPAGATVGDVLRLVEARFPELAGKLGSVRVARNEAFADASEPLLAGDTIALIPPVAGG